LGFFINLPKDGPLVATLEVNSLWNLVILGTQGTAQSKWPDIPNQLQKRSL